MVAKGVTFGVEQLLNVISTFLNGDGGLRNEDDCVKFNNCMRRLGKSMHNICTYLNVINATTDEAILSKLLASGAWDTLFDWLNEYKELEHSPLLVLLLETFQRLPVTMDMLKANTAAKTIKSLRKHSDEEVKARASETVDKWMQLIKSKTNGVASPAHPSSKNGEHKEKEKKKKRHKHSSGEKSEERKPDVAEAPPHPDQVDRDVPSPPPAAIFKESAKSAGSERSDRSTTKQHNVKERSAGVEAGVIKPKPRGSKPSTPISSPAATGRPAAASNSATLASHKRVNIELPGLTDIGATTNPKKQKIDPDKEEDFGKAKLIAPLPKPTHIVQDSGGFMAALLQPKTPTMIRKKKSKAPSSPTDKTSPPNTPVSPTSAPPSFYKDTLEGPSGVSPVHPPSVDSSDRMSPVESTVSSHSNSNSEEVKPEPMDISEVKSNKKRVSWKPDKELREYHLFELLEDERVNVNRIRDQGGFDEMKKREMVTDREALKGMHSDQQKPAATHSNAPPAVTEKFQWKRPAPLDLPSPKMPPGHQSKERDVQSRREVSVLAAIYFNKASMPTSASEPDHTADTEPSGQEDTIVIPLEISGSSALAETFQTEAPAHVAPVVAPEAQGDVISSVTDLVPGMTATDLDMLEKLAREGGEGFAEVAEVLANTTPDYLNQIMQTEGIASLDNGVYSGDDAQPAPRGVPPPNMPLMSGPPPRGYNGGPPPYHEHRGGFHPGRGGGPRPPFNRGGFRGWGGGRGRGGPRGGFGSGRGGGGRGSRNSECRHFQQLGRCDFGNKCSFLHSAR